mmetsp:Transcript_47677/g.137243  ORF Transcript_47677/g.137243 Transcript_47677/m.137243 type:complete len:142 (+) Transcript_47677:785-1210(+)
MKGKTILNLSRSEKEMWNLLTDKSCMQSLLKSQHMKRKRRRSILESRNGRRGVVAWVIVIDVGIVTGTDQEGERTMSTTAVVDQGIEKMIEIGEEDARMIEKRIVETESGGTRMKIGVAAARRIANATENLSPLLRVIPPG